MTEQQLLQQSPRIEATSDSAHRAGARVPVRPDRPGMGLFPPSHALRWIGAIVILGMIAALRLLSLQSWDAIRIPAFPDALGRSPRFRFFRAFRALAGAVSFVILRLDRLEHHVRADHFSAADRA